MVENKGGVFMKLKVATRMATIGSVLLIVSFIYNILMNFGAIEISLENYKSHYFVIGILNCLAGISFLNFFVSFLIAQSKKGGSK